MADPKCCCDLTVHPDHLISDSFLLDAEKRYELLPVTCHLLFAEAFVQEGAETSPVYVKLFTSDDPDTEADDEEQWTLQMAKAIGSNAFTPEDVRGLVFHKGLFARIVSADTTAKVVVNYIAVRREHYTPAFPDPTAWLLNAWNCWRSEQELYDNFDTGGDYGWGNSGASGGAGSVLPDSTVD